MAGTPTVVTLEPVTDSAVRVILSETLSVGAWTTVKHIESGSVVTLGVLPADVNGDAVASPVDILTLIDALNGAIEPLPEWSADVDRSGAATPADILRVIDLLSGAEVYKPFNGQQLP